MENFNLNFTGQQLQVIASLLQQAPYHVAAPILNEIERQIIEQRTQDVADETKVSHPNAPKPGK